MRILKKALLVILPLSLMGVSVYLYNRTTDGFSLHQLCSTLPFNVFYETGALSLKERERIWAILDQPYTYIGKGCQFYAFESADGNYVLKFLKQKHLRTYNELKELPLPSFIQKKLALQNARRKNRHASLFSSCKLAYEELPQESGLIFLHLNRSAVFGKKVRIYDKMGMKHDLPIDQYEFILQKKGIAATEVFKTITADELAERVGQIARIIKSRCERGVADKDPAFIQNTAFTKDGSAAFFIDIGQFYKEPLVLRKPEQLTELKSRLRSLELFLEKYRPDLLESFTLLISCPENVASWVEH